jgi:hypothetical protein
MKASRIIESRCLVFALGAAVAWILLSSDGLRAQDSLGPGVEEANLLILIASAQNLRKALRLLPAFDTVTFRDSMSRDSWKGTLDWLSKRTGLPLAGRVIPAKAFHGPITTDTSFIDTGRAIDILNRELADQHLLIIRGARTLHVVFTDEAIDLALVPQVRWADLKERGKTELVSVAVAFKGLKAADMAALVKKSLSRFGRVWDEPCNQLIVLDRAERVIEALAIIRKVGNEQEVSPRGNAE